MPYASIDYSKTLSMSKDHLAFCHSSTELFEERFSPYNRGFFFFSFISENFWKLRASYLNEV